MRTSRVMSVVAASTLALLIGSSAFGQVQGKGQAKCINTLNKDTCKVAATAGKNNSGCVKNATKGTPSATCVPNDGSGKVAGTQAKTTADETKNLCTTTNAPNFGYGGASTGNTAAQDAEVNLFSDTYGSTDTTGVISTDKTIGKCQSGATKDLEKLIATKWKTYLKCKKTALATATDATALAACAASVQADAKVTGTITKLGADIGKNCSAVTIATAFPGSCSASTAMNLNTCLDQRAECRFCEALNSIDGLGINCDLFDDATANGSCGIPVHKCTLSGGIANSYVNIYSAAFPVPISFNTSGSSIDVGGKGTAAKCAVQNFNPINIIAIGYVCIQPGGNCPNGTRYCGPGAPGSGPPLGVDSLADGNVGTCTGNADCQAQCNTKCPMEYGAGFAPLSAQCTGFCTQGAQMACTTDAQCNSAGQGSCNGPDNPGVNAGICQCACQNLAAFGGSDPGDLQCNLSAALTVESAPPCNGTDVIINVGNSCIPVGSQRGHGRIDDGNFTGGSTVPGAMPGPNANDQTGSPEACATMDTSVTTGFAGVGVVNFFGSTLGDLSVGLKATCM
jgi:hypothetical protein